MTKSARNAREILPVASASSEPQTTEVRLLSPQELSALLGVPVRTLADWRSARKGPLPIRFGVHVRYRLVDVEAWLEARVREAHEWMAS